MSPSYYLWSHVPSDAIDTVMGRSEAKTRLGPELLDLPATLATARRARCAASPSRCVYAVWEGTTLENYIMPVAFLQSTINKMACVS
jgi:hypothetical protein